TILTAGIFVTSIFLLLFIRKTKSKDLAKEETLKGKPTNKNLMKVLSENPDSRASNKIKLALCLILFIVFFLLLGKILFAILIATGIYILIGVYFNRIKQKELEKFENQLIDALSLITNFVRSGQALLQAIENMIKESKPPISIEFGKALQQIKLGTPTEEALNDIAKRVKSKDLRIAIISINLAKETGGNLGEILTRLADTMRERKKIQGKVDALTAQGKASGIIVGSIPLLLLGILYFLEPQMFGLMFSTLLGNVLFTIVILMISMGMFFINRLVKIDI
ncbi:MAG: type II secretion system F family protein, partial [Endomicrobiales bacterium]|nr:type II secretion system F family protein [Endomicrobiales bacterium]